MHKHRKNVTTQNKTKKIKNTKGRNQILLSSLLSNYLQFTMITSIIRLLTSIASNTKLFTISTCIIYNDY